MLYYVTVEKNGVHVETHRFASFQEARQYAYAVKAARRGVGVEVWIGQDGEGAVKL